jgi:hypothetical protein
MRGIVTIETFSTPHRSIWSPPWGFAEALLIPCGLVLVGLVLQYLVPNTLSPALVWPVNAWLFGGLVVLLALGQGLGGGTRAVRWLGSVPAAVGATVGFAAVGLLMGVVPQGPAPAGLEAELAYRLGLHDITGSWPYLLAVAWFLLVLGFATARRLWPLTLANLGFFLSHGGLFLAVAGAHLGANDLQRVTLHLQRDQVTWQGEDRQGRQHEFDFAFKLTRFDIEEYPPEVGLVDRRTGDLEGGQRVELPAAALKPQGDPAGLRLQAWDLTVREYLESAARVGDRYVAVRDLGTARAALVQARRVADGLEVQGWITCGSFLRQPQVLDLEPRLSLVMLQPRPKRFLSEATLYQKDGPTRAVTLEVNKPLAVAGWKVYQLSYDQDLGRWSNVSILEAVRDPWLPLVYTGIFLMIAGALWLGFLGAKGRD